MTTNILKQMNLLFKLGKGFTFSEAGDDKLYARQTKAGAKMDAMSQKLHANSKTSTVAQTTEETVSVTALTGMAERMIDALISSWKHQNLFNAQSVSKLESAFSQSGINATVMLQSEREIFIRTSTGTATLRLAKGAMLNTVSVNGSELSSSSDLMNALS